MSTIVFGWWTYLKDNNFILVSSKVLPPVFEGVLLAKQLLADGRAANATQAVKMAGISRSAFYKYRDCVFEYSAGDANSVNISAVLSDKAGVFSALTTVLYKYGANIITVNQGMPVDGAASASLTVRTDNLKLPINELLEKLRKTDGIISVKIL